MDGLLNAIVTLVADDESAPGLALVVVGAAAWAVSLFVGVTDAGRFHRHRGASRHRRVHPFGGGARGGLAVGRASVVS